MRCLSVLIALWLSIISFASETPCLDPLACNFMEEGECFFIDENGNPCVIEGCTIQGACNYDPEADLYDGSCEFESCLGCTDEAACNYDDFALYNDGSCIYSAPFSLSIAANIDYFDDEFNGYGACIDTEYSFSAEIIEGNPNIISWLWSWEDGTSITTDSPFLNHSFTSAGVHQLQLHAMDELGCSNSISTQLSIYVTAEIDFDFFVTTPICPEAYGHLLVDQVNYGSSLSSFDGGLIPDDPSNLFQSNLEVIAPDGLQLENCDDLLSVTVNMEHSYMGDLDLTITCPDGTTVALMSYPNGGGNCFLGEAVDIVYYTSETPGVGYDYGWSPNPDIESNINDNANWTQTAYTDNAGNNMFSNIANPGIYTPEGDLCDLVGCPVNGTWIFSVRDNLFADNGHLFNWELEFTSDSLYSLEVEAVSSSFYFDTTLVGYNDSLSGVFFENDAGDSLSYSFDNAGNYAVTYEEVNTLGCSADTTIVIEVVPSIISGFSLGEDINGCDSGYPIALNIPELGIEPISCQESTETVIHCYDNNENTSWLYCPDNIGDGTMMEILFFDGQIEGYFDYIQVFDGNDNNAPLLLNLTGDYPQSFVAATNPDGCLYVQFSSDGSVSCGSGNFDPISWSAGCNQSVSFTWNWDPSDLVDDANQSQTTITNLNADSTLFILEAQDLNISGCLVRDSIWVVLDSTCFGCTQQLSCNFNQAATYDDGSCDHCFCLPGTQWSDSLQGCAAIESICNEACGEGTIWDSLSETCIPVAFCSSDLDQDGIVSVSDILILLSDFGIECPPETAEWICSNPVNYHGYNYATVEIGEQCWFAENLRTELYMNGDSIPGGLSDGEWGSTTEGAQAVYNNDTPNLSDYGRLYNWYAVDDTRGLCPSGWHVATDDEWTDLE
jgi:subtilisin-like proprotein convertase family protein